MCRTYQSVSDNENDEHDVYTVTNTWHEEYGFVSKFLDLCLQQSLFEHSFLVVNCCKITRTRS